MKKKAKPESLSTAARQCALCEDGNQHSDADEIHEQAKALFDKMREAARISPTRSPGVPISCFGPMEYYIVEAYVHGYIMGQIK